MKRKIIYSFAFLIIVAAGYIAFKIFGPTVSAPEKKYFYVSTGQNYNQVKNNLLELKIINGGFWFSQVAKKLNFIKNIKPGRYEITDGMSIYNLVKMLRFGKQTPVNFVITKLRTKEDLAQKIAANFQCDSISIISFLNNQDSLQKFNLDTNTIMTAIIPNTYSIVWNASPEKIFKKLYVEQQKFWDANRLKKAAALNMAPQKIYILASIVEEETNKQDDKGKIASVYFNRLASGTKLEADPTVKFAMKNFGLKRILFSHLTYPSLYNTYLHKGLPPGPICTPAAKTIDAVLDEPKTTFLFFVAKPNFDGYSNFASTFAEHQINAKAYQYALDSLLKAKAKQ